jgi:hypothetical protein
MRKLGSAHSVAFLIPEDVVNAICSATGCEKNTLSTEDLLLWTMEETCQQIRSNVANWALQGHTFAEQDENWQCIRGSERTKINKEMIRPFYETESRTLEELYDIGGPENTVRWALRLHSRDAPNPISQAIANKCDSIERFSLNDSSTQEEKEVELVHEQEVERKIQRPPAALPTQHNIHPHVRNFVEIGALPLGSTAIQPVAQTLQHISLPFPKGFKNAFSNLYATFDFSKTIQIHQSETKGEMNAYLRPVE